MTKLSNIQPDRISAAVIDAAVAGIPEAGAVLALVAVHSGLLTERDALRIVGPYRLAEARKEVR